MRVVPAGMPRVGGSTSRLYTALDAWAAELDSLARDSGEPGWEIAVRHVRAEMARMRGDLDRAAALYLENQRASQLASTCVRTSICFGSSTATRSIHTARSAS